MLRLLRLKLLMWLVLMVLLALANSVTAGMLFRAYYYLRGRRNRDHGIPWIQCRRTAFPVEGTATRYRCCLCGCRFDGPEHF
jgi:hypothetical protein